MGRFMQPICAFAETQSRKVAPIWFRSEALRKRRVPVDTKHEWSLRVPSAFIEGSTHLFACQKQTALYYGRRSFTTCGVSSLLRQVSVGNPGTVPSITKAQPKWTKRDARLARPMCVFIKCWAIVMVQVRIKHGNVDEQESSKHDQSNCEGWPTPRQYA